VTPTRSSRNGAPATGGARPSTAKAAARPAERGIPEATVARLPVYLRALVALAEQGITTCSSEELATAAGVNSAKLRKDLSYLGSYGTRGVGYDVEYLRYQIAREIGVTQDWPVVIVGIGNLGHALANYAGFSSRGFRVVALLDADPQRQGEQVGEMPIRPFDDLEELAAHEHIAIGVVATPAPAAQEVADRLVAAGVRSILNFAPTVLNVPAGVDVRKVDLSIELQILAYHEQRKAVAEGTIERLDQLDDLPERLPDDLPEGLPQPLGADLVPDLTRPEVAR
jgi:redox-sensing transcriptional repressor